MARHKWEGDVTRAELRIRRKPRNETILTLVAPASALMFYFRHDPFTQTLLTVRGNRWSQVERRLRYGLRGGGVYTKTTITELLHRHSIEIRNSLSKGGEAVR